MKSARNIKYNKFNFHKIVSNFRFSSKNFSPYVRVTVFPYFRKRHRDTLYVKERSRGFRS